MSRASSPVVAVGKRSAMRINSMSPMKLKIANPRSWFV